MRKAHASCEPLKNAIELIFGIEFDDVYIIYIPKKIELSTLNEREPLDETQNRLPLGNRLPDQVAHLRATDGQIRDHAIDFANLLHEVLMQRTDSLFAFVTNVEIEPGARGFRSFELNSGLSAVLSSDHRMLAVQLGTQFRFDDGDGTVSGDLLDNGRNDSTVVFLERGYEEQYVQLCLQN